MIFEAARAKLNLALHVTGRREDGYHLLDSFVVFADVGDTLTVALDAAPGLSVTGPMAPGVPTGPGNLVPNNLVYNPVSFIWTLDDAGKCTMWEGYWDQEDSGMTAALGAVMAKMPKPE